MTKAACRLLLAACLLRSSAVVLAQVDPAHQQFLFAYKLWQRGDTELATEAFDTYLKRFPDAPKRGDAIYYQALLYRQSHRNDLAAKCLLHVPEPLLLPSHSLDLLRGQVYADVGDWDRAVAATERIDDQSLEPESRAQVQFVRSLAYRGAGNLSAAAKSMRLASDEASSSLRPQILLELAVTLTRMAKHSDALEVLRNDLPQAAHATAPRANRLAGDLSYHLGDYDGALAYYSTLIERHQSSEHFGPAVLGLLSAHLAANRFEAVLKQFDRYRQMLEKPHHNRGAYLAGSAASAIGHHNEAAEYFKHASELDNGVGEDSLYKLAATQYQLQQYGQMRQTLDLLHRQYPQSRWQGESVLLRATAEAEAGEPSQAAAMLTELVGGDGNSPYLRQALAQRAHLYESQGQLDAAVTDFRRLLDLGPVSAESHNPLRLHLIDLYHRDERYEEAESLAQDVLQQSVLDPATEQEAMYRLAMARLSGHKSEAALDALQTLDNRHPLHRFQGHSLYYRGLLLLSMNRTESAITFLSDAAEDQSLPKPLRCNAHRLSALHYRQVGPAETAAGALKQLDKLGRLDDNERLWLGTHELTEGHLNQAIAWIKPLLNRNAAAMLIVAKARRQLGQLDAAETVLRQVIAAGDGPVESARIELARTLSDQGNLRAALAELNDLISAETSQIAAQAILESAVIHRRIGQNSHNRQGAEIAKQANEEALRLLKRFVLLYPFKQLEPLPQRAYMMLDEILTETHDPAAALIELTEMLSAFPHGPYALFAKARIAMLQQKYGDALGWINRLTDTPADTWLSPRVIAIRMQLEAAQ